MAFLWVVQRCFMRVSKSNEWTDCPIGVSCLNVKCIASKSTGCCRNQHWTTVFFLFFDWRHNGLLLQGYQLLANMKQHGSEQTSPRRLSKIAPSSPRIEVIFLHNPPDCLSECCFLWCIRGWKENILPYGMPPFLEILHFPFRNIGTRAFCIKAI